MDAAGDRQIHLLDYWQVLSRRRWVIYSSLITVTGLVTLGSFLARPMYTAMTQLQVEKFSPNVLPFQDVVTSYSDWRDDFHETQLRLIQSRTVARIAARNLEIWKNPAFALDDTMSDDQREVTAAEMVRGHMEASLIRNSRLINISFESHDPNLAALLANAVADAYIEFNTQTAYNTSEQATQSVSRLILRLRDEIDEKERKLQEYAREREIIPLDEKQDMHTQKLNDLNVAYTRAQTSRIEKEARYAALKETPADQVTELMVNDLLQSLAGKHAELERQYAQMSSRFKPDWPAMARLKSELEKTAARLESERSDLYQRMLGAAREEYAAAFKEEQSLGDALEDQKRAAQEAGLRAIEYKNIKLEVENRRKTLDELLKRQTETDTKAGMADTPLSNIRVVDRAEPPRFPSSPRKGLNFLMSLAAGLGLGVALAFFFDYMDDSVNSAEDLIKTTGLACIGMVPVHSRQGRRLRVVRAARNAQEDSRPEIDMATLRDTQSHTAEAFRELRTTLLVSSPGKAPRSLLVTSAQPREGKTATAVNLAITLSQLNRKVLLVDTDLRRPRLHKALGKTNHVGLSNYLSGNEDLPGLIVPAGPPGLFLLPSGPTPPNSAELLDSKEFADLVKRLVDRAQGISFDHVVYDSPPVLSVADAAIIASRMDGVIVVVQAGLTTKDSMARAVERLRVVQARLLGALLNKVDMTSPGSYYRYYRSYYSDDEQSAESGRQPKRLETGTRGEQA